MALALDTIRDNMQISIHGRRCFVDINGNLGGFKGITRPVTDGTSDTTGTALPNYGINRVVTSTNDTWTLTDPYVGAEVTLMTGSSSTGVHTVSPAAAVIYSTNGIAGSGVVLTGAGACVSLLGISTGIWQVTSMAGSTPSNYISS